MGRVSPRVVAVLNPASRRFTEARSEVERGVRSAGLGEPEVLTTTREAPGAAQARAALDAGAQLVVVGGGDGTVREVAGVLAGTTATLGIVPVGTANLFARNLGLGSLGPGSRGLGRAVHVALTGHTRAVDVGLASWREVTAGVTGPPTPERTFLVVAGIGHDAATVLATRPEFKESLGWLAYLESGARHLTRPALRMRVSADGRPLRAVETWCVLAGNCGRLPGGVRVFPDARLDDGVLDILEVPLTSPGQWASVAAKGALRLPGDVPALRYGTARRLWVIPDTPAPLQLDGDVVPAVADLRVRVLRRALHVHAHPTTTGAP